MSSLLRSTVLAVIWLAIAFSAQATLLAQASAQASAQLNVVKEAITLDLAFQSALARSETVAIQEERIIQAEERFRQEFSRNLPAIWATGGAMLRPELTGNNAFASPIFPGFSPVIAISAKGPIFRGLREFGELGNGRKLTEAQRKARDQAIIQLYLDVAQNYFGLLLADVELKGLMTQVESLKTLKSGRSAAAGAEILNIDAALAQSEARLLGARELKATFVESLSFLTGLPADLSIQDNETPPRKLEPLDSFLEMIQERPDVRAASLQVDAADASVWTAKAGHLPTADLQANYYPVRPTGVYQDLIWDVAVVARLPIFSGLSTMSQVRQAVAEKTEREKELRLARRHAEEQIRAGYRLVSAGIGKLPILEKAAELTERSRQGLMRDFASGRGRVLEVLRAIEAATQSRAEFQRTRLETSLEFHRLEASVLRHPDIPAQRSQ